MKKNITKLAAYLLCMLMLLSAGCAPAAPAGGIDVSNMTPEEIIALADALQAGSEEAEPEAAAENVIPLEEVDDGIITPQLTGKENIDPARFPADIKETMKQYSKDSRISMSDLSADNFKYALLVQEGDFTRINPNVWDQLYTYPYNIYSFDASTQEGLSPPDHLADADYGFKSNVECMELYGEDFLIRCINIARKFVRGNSSVDYTDHDKNRQYAQECCEAMSLLAGVQVLTGAKNEWSDKYEAILHTDLATDISLVYQDVEGYFRVRGTVVDTYEHIKSDDWQNGEVNHYDIEVVVVPKDDRVAVRGDIPLGALKLTTDHDKNYLTSVIAELPTG